MIVVLSPAKKLDFSINLKELGHSIPAFIDEAGTLIKILKKLKPLDISSLMGISAKLADLNYERFLRWDKNHHPENSKTAIFAFNGDVYDGLDAKSIPDENLVFLDKNIRILSGLYGVLRPLDLMKAYRLEMGTKLENKNGDDLYKFWGKKIAKNINSAIEQSDGEKILINLASNEYFKSIDIKTLKYQIITPIFKEYKDGEYHVISFFAKKARGMMARFISQEKITNPERLKFFNLGAYCFNQELSSDNQWVFIR